MNALRARGLEVSLSEEDTIPSDAGVVVRVGEGTADAPISAALALVLPESLADEASADVIAEYLMARERAAILGVELAAHHVAQREIVEKVTHDLNNNIAVVRANLSYVQSTMTMVRDVAEALEEATDSTRQMEQTLADLKLMIALELGTVSVSRDRVALAPLLQSAGADWQQRMNSRNVQLDVSLPAELYARGQATLLRRIFANLLNARSRSARNTTIEVRGHTDGDDLVVTVADGGVSVLPEDRMLALSRVGVNSPRIRELGGTGVALYVSRLIAEAHGGQLSLVDLPPWSCCFRVSLPSAAQGSLSPPPTTA